MNEKIILRKGKNQDGLDDISPITVILHKSDRDYPKKLTEQDVWGDGGYNRETKENRGMRVAVFQEECPIFKDIVPYKSCTIIYPKTREEEVLYWMEYVYGPIDVVKKELDDIRVAARVSSLY